MEKKNIGASILMNAYDAMLGEIFPALRQLNVEWDEKNITLRAYIDGMISEEDRDSISIIFAEMTTHFIDTHDGSFEVIRYDVPQNLNIFPGHIIYRRRER